MSALPHTSSPKRALPYTVSTCQPPPTPQMLAKKVFTTGQVAKLCFVAPRTVSKWFDTGKLRGYRIPGSQDRRVLRSSLIQFLRESGMEEVLAMLEGASRSSVLAVGMRDLDAQRLTDLLPAGCILDRASDAFEAGLALASPGQLAPLALILDAGVLGRGVVLALMGQLAAREMTSPTIVLVPDDGDPAEYLAGGAALAEKNMLAADLLLGLLNH